VPASDLAAWCTQARLSARGRAIIDPVERLRPFEPMSWRSFLRASVPSRDAIVRVVRHVRAGSRAPAVALLPDGDRSVLAHLGFVQRLRGGAWPTEPLWVCAVRASDGRRTVFGQPDSPTTPLARALAASCAVPGYFAPVAIEGERYVDGGVHSPTNADVVDIGEPWDLVVVVSPLSAYDRVPASVGGALRRLCRRLLHREVATLEARGLPVLTLEPGAGVIDAMANDMMDVGALLAVTREAFLETGLQIAAAGGKAGVLSSRIAA
jgi:NTE family protein